MCHYLFLSTAGRGILLLFHLTLTFSWRTVLFNAMKYRSRITSLCFSLIAERAVVAVCVARVCCSFTSTWRHSFNSFTSENQRKVSFYGCSSLLHTVSRKIKTNWKLWSDQKSEPQNPVKLPVSVFNVHISNSQYYIITINRRLDKGYHQNWFCVNTSEPSYFMSEIQMSKEIFMRFKKTS